MEVAADCQRALYTKLDSSECEVLHDEKLHAMESIIEELGDEQLLVAYKLKSDLSRLKSRFLHAGELKTQFDENDWNRGDGTVPLMLITTQSGGHCINLQHGGRNIAWFSHPFNLRHLSRYLSPWVLCAECSRAIGGP